MFAHTWESKTGTLKVLALGQGFSPLLSMITQMMSLFDDPLQLLGKVLKFLSKSLIDQEEFISN